MIPTAVLAVPAAIQAGVPASIPSPDQAVWHLGPFPLRAYALCILAGIVVAMWTGDRRWVARGGEPGLVYDVAIWAVPFGIVGGRIYHVLTDWSTYFGPDGAGFVAALRIWSGGLGIWGAIALGAVGAWIGCHRRGVLLPPFADALAVGVPLAQALGRWGNWFNQELFGRPTDVAWALEIDPVNRPAGYEQYATFHPTFLYESLWLVGVAILVAWADRRWRLGHGRAFALYVAAYCVGRLGMELLRIDPATQLGGIRINVFTSVVVGLGAVVYIVLSARTRPGREPAAALQSGAAGSRGQAPAH
ncbi:MAG: prolipoprotein diacylglyceryl transferase [Candidatus Nanopelagicales bacterium]